jgi:tetratricopeptide (TPR) repeat protein
LSLPCGPSRFRAGVLLALAVAATAAARADTIVLVDGREIHADRAWYEGSEVRYEKDGLTAGVPRRLVKSVEQKSPPAETTDPRVLAARRDLTAGDAAAAVKRLEATVAIEPRMLPALETLAEAYLKLGDAHKARDAADRALHVDDRCAHCLSLRGDALVALGDRVGAQDAYQKSLLVRPDSEVEHKLAVAAPTSAPTLPPPSRSAQFRLQYDGSINEPLSMAVLEVLSEAYGEYAKTLGSSPEKPVTVLLQTSADFHEDAGAPGWAEGLNDGTIRVPLRGVEKPSPRLAAVLRHELAHSFITDRTGGNCPTWLQEGIAQWLEGGDPGREDVKVAAVARAKKMHPLVTLEAPFANLSEAEATTAYSESLSAVAHILRKRGEAGVARLLAALADGVDSEEALPVALALSYPEFQKSWEEYLLKLTSGTPTATVR